MCYIENEWRIIEWEMMMKYIASYEYKSMNHRVYKIFLFRITAKYRIKIDFTNFFKAIPRIIILGKNQLIAN